MVFSFNQFDTQYDNNYSIKVLRKNIEYSQLLSQFIVTLRQTKLKLKCKISMCIKTSKEKTKIILYCNNYVLISKIQNGLKLNTQHFMTFLHYK